MPFGTVCLGEGVRKHAGSFFSFQRHERLWSGAGSIPLGFVLFAWTTRSAVLFE